MYMSHDKSWDLEISGKEIQLSLLELTMFHGVIGVSRGMQTAQGNVGKC